MGASDSGMEGYQVADELTRVQSMFTAAYRDLSTSACPAPNLDPSSSHAINSTNTHSRSRHGEDVVRPEATHRRLR